jgi:acyl-CoA synthetase (NDP forming)
MISEMPLMIGRHKRPQRCSLIDIARKAGPQAQVASHTSLANLVDPRSVAIIGASDRAGSLSLRTVENLVDYSNFSGQTYLISKSKPEIKGRKTFPSILETPEAPDVALLVVPYAATLDTLRECGRRGVKFAIVFTSGFGEMNEVGREAEREMARIAKDTGMRIYGPNCPGLCNQNKRVGLMFSPSWRVDQKPGNIGVATQGGGIGRCFLQAADRGVGVGLFASTGNEADLTVADFIRYMADADDIKVIAAAMEGIRDGGAFTAAALYAAQRGKPVVAVKVGRTEFGAKAVASHTGSISGTAEVNSAAFRQAGVIEVDSLDELIDTAALFSRKYPTGTEKVAVYSFSGGNCVMMADAVSDGGMQLSHFSPETVKVMTDLLPDYAAVNNPVDLTSDVLSDVSLGYTTLKAVANDPDVGIVLYPFPCDYDGLTGAIADAAVKAQAETQRPIVPIWMSDRLGPGWKSLVEGGMMPMRLISQASKAAQRWIERGRWTYPTGWHPLPTGIATARVGKRIPVGEAEAKLLLQKAGVPVPAGSIARSADEAAMVAAKVGFPVVAKIASLDITHKSDVGGVAIGLRDAKEVREAYDRIVVSVRNNVPTAALQGVLIEAMAGAGGVEVLVGVHRDPIFGPVMTFGLGGVYIELFKDVSRRLLPLTPEAAEGLLTEPRCSAILRGARGKVPADLAALQKLMLSVSDFVCTRSDSIEELELNPVWVGPKGRGVVALDAVLITNDSRDQQ